MHGTLKQCPLPNADEDFGDEGDPEVVWGDDDAVDTLWLGFVTSIDSTNAAVAMLEESCRLLIGSLFPSALSLVLSYSISVIGIISCIEDRLGLYKLVGWTASTSSNWVTIISTACSDCDSFSSYPFAP